MARSADLSDPLKLELQKKHTIEVVIDRFKVRDDLSTRLAESFETALELSGGTAIVANMDDPKPKSCCFPPTSPARFAATACANWNRACSPSTTGWRCPTCDGLGVQQYLIRNASFRTQSCRWLAGDSRLGSAQFLLLPDAEVAGGTL